MRLWVFGHEGAPIGFANALQLIVTNSPLLTTLSQTWLILVPHI